MLLAGCESEKSDLVKETVTQWNNRSSKRVKADGFYYWEYTLSQNMASYCKLTHFLPHFWLTSWSWVFEWVLFVHFTVCILTLFCEYKLESKGVLFKYSKIWQNKYYFLSNRACFCKSRAENQEICINKPFSLRLFR